MLYEYALDPGVLYNFDKVRYFLEKFGVHRGRLISRFPRKWKRMVWEACVTCGDIERKRIEESLINADVKFISSNRDYNGNSTWLNNAEDQHALRPFHAIISKSNPRASAVVLIADDLTETTPLWNVPRERVVPRKAFDLASHIEPLLRMATEVIFIDPYFDPYAPRYRRTLKAFARVIHSNGGHCRIEYHLKYSDSAFQDGCQANLPSILPTGLEIKFIRWRQIDGGETLHPRYILTDRGGVRIEHGLDEGRDGECTDVSLLDLSVYQQRWKDYREAPAFEFVDEITIAGS